MQVFPNQMVYSVDKQEKTIMFIWVLRYRRMIFRNKYDIDHDFILQSGIKLLINYFSVLVLKLFSFNLPTVTNYWFLY